MSGLASGATLTPSTTSSALSQAASSILPYTKGLTGVNLRLNSITSDALYGSLGLLFIIILVVRITQVFSSHLRLLASLNTTNHQQQYWTRDSHFWPKIKKNLLVAPLIRQRHNREIQLSSAVNVGTIPSRLHTTFLSFYVLTNVLYCCLLDYHGQPRAALLAEVRGRTGHLSVMNMIPLFLFSTRNNLLIPLLGISFDTFNLFHRWIGRIVVIEGIAHTFIWGVNNYDALGLKGLTDRLWTDFFLIYGFIAAAAMLVILFQSVSIIRHAFYESFLHLHQLLAVASLVGILLHCEIEALPQKPLIYTLIAIWCIERLTRLWRIFSHRGTKVWIEALEGGACRLTFDIRGTWSNSPGSHLYAYIPSVSLWMSHPFSVAWVDRHASQGGPALSIAQTLAPPSANDGSETELKSWPRNTRTTISCIVASRSGMTASLYERARRSHGKMLSLTAFVEGPYGGLESLRSYGTVMLFAGGVGITHQISHVHDLVCAFSDRTCSTRKVVLVWSIRTVEQLEWVRPWMHELLEMPLRGNSLKIMLYVTRSVSGDDEVVRKETDHLQRIQFRRMPVRQLVEEEFHRRVGAMCIGVCGPGGLADDVRASSRTLMDRGKVDFWEEAFTW